MPDTAVRVCLQDTKVFAIEKRSILSKKGPIYRCGWAGMAIQADRAEVRVTPVTKTEVATCTDQKVPCQLTVKE